MKHRQIHLCFVSALFYAVACVAGPALAQVTLPSGYSFTQIAVSDTSQTLPKHRYD
jgi:hypothetical protein